MQLCYISYRMLCRVISNFTIDVIAMTVFAKRIDCQRNPNTDFVAYVKHNVFLRENWRYTVASINHVSKCIKFACNPGGGCWNPLSSNSSTHTTDPDYCIHFI